MLTGAQDAKQKLCRIHFLLHLAATITKVQWHGSEYVAEDSVLQTLAA